MTTPLIRPTATVAIDGTAFRMRRGSTCSLDSARVPYAGGDLQLPMLDEATLAELDPRAGARVLVSHAIDGGTPRTFDLAVRRLQADHRSKTVSLELASDELLLQMYRALTVDQGAREHETSARAICNYVLDKIGAELEPGTDDADVTAAWALTNLITNHANDGNLTGYVPGTNAASVSSGTTSPKQGAAYVRWQGVADGSTFLAVPISDTRVEAGEVFTYNAYLRSSAAAQQGRLYVQFKDSAGTVVGNGALSPLVALATGTDWSELSLTFTVPEGVVSAQPYAVGSGVAGTTYAVDAITYYKGNEFVEFFYGSSPTDALYTYEWVGDVGSSPSTRTPIVERLPELFIWQPGTTAWDFLMAITVSAGLVLWCDEMRAWWLATPEHRTIPTLVSVSEWNTRDGTDAIDVDDDETTPTGIVVHYTWTDQNGDAREAFDSAGTPERAQLVELKAPYPGPGTAATILARRQGTGRRQDVTTITQLATTPGMTAQVSLPAAPDTNGRITSVEFDMAEGFMTLGMAGFVDVIPGSVDALTGTVDDLVGTVDSL